MILNKKKRRTSSQREAIYRLIERSSSHPTAAQVFTWLKKIMPSASLGNVYRNIKILVEVGRVASRDFGDGIEHFDAVTGQHYHFVCERCGDVSDFHLPVKHDVMTAAQKHTRHRITGHTINFFGVCRVCLAEKGK